MKSAIEAVKKELWGIQMAMNDCATEEGIVKPYMRERYLVLMKKELELKNSLDWLLNAKEGVKTK